MTTEEKKKNAKRAKSLSELGKLIALKVLVDNSFKKIVNLNDENPKYPFANLYAEKEGKKYVIKVRTRNKYQKDNTLNAFYKLGGNAYDKALEAMKDLNAKAYWMAVQFDEHSYSIYFGSLEELGNKDSIPLRKCEKGEIGTCMVKDKTHYFDFDFFGNKKDIEII